MPFPNKMFTRCKICKNFVYVGTGMTEGPPWATYCKECWPNHPKLEAPPSVISVIKRNSDVIFKPVSFLGAERFSLFRSCTEGVRFDVEKKLNYTTIDKVEGIVSRLREAKFIVNIDPVISSDLQSFRSNVNRELRESDDRIEEIEKLLSNRGLSLFPFQREGIKWLISRYGALLADQMGLGKTIQAAIAIPYPSPVLIVCPAIAKGVWKRELERWRPDLRIITLSGRGTFVWPKSGQAVITNYDILPDLTENDDSEDLEENVPLWVDRDAPENSILVADEAHYLVNLRSQRTIKFRKISDIVQKKSGRVWLLTATPLLNKPPELWNVFQAAGIAQEAFGSWKQFVNLFNGKSSDFGGTIWGLPTEEVSDRIRRVALRRERSEVLADLPEKSWREIEVDIDASTRLLCDEVLGELRKAGIDLDNAASLVRITRANVPEFSSMSKVRSALATSKIPAMLSLIEEYEQQEEPIVVFSAHRAPIDSLSSREGWAVITGDTSPENRSIIESNFQAGKLKGVAATIQAGGVAITLTKAAHAIFVDLLFTPALNDQAEDRLVRIGQTRGVLITNLVAKHSLDRRVYEILHGKRNIINGCDM